MGLALASVAPDHVANRLGRTEGGRASIGKKVPGKQGVGGMQGVGSSRFVGTDPEPTLLWDGQFQERTSRVRSRTGQVITRTARISASRVERKMELTGRPSRYAKIVGQALK